MHQRVLRLGGLGFGGSRYVDLALARARVRLGFSQGAEPFESLQSLSGDLRVPSHVRWSAVRWLARLLGKAGDAEVRGSVLSPLIAAADPDEGDDLNARTSLALIDLDVALQRGEQRKAQHALELLEELDPGPVGHLIGAAKRLGESAPSYVARFYPY
jgi:hypothetical protein